MGVFANCVPATRNLDIVFKKYSYCFQQTATLRNYDRSINRGNGMFPRITTGGQYHGRHQHEQQTPLNSSDTDQRTRRAEPGHRSSRTQHARTGTAERAADAAAAGGTAAQAPQSEQPQAEEPRTPFQTPVQHPEFRQAQQQTGFGEVPPMSQSRTPRRIKSTAEA